MVRTNKQSGFTLIEMLMVILLVAILSAVAIPQFIDFRSEARNAAVASAVGALRTGLATQVGSAIVRCNATPGFIFKGVAVKANSITRKADDSGEHATAATVAAADPCAQSMISNAAERKFVPAIPANPWSKTPANASDVAICTGCFANRLTKDCGGTNWDPVAGVYNGWCYDESTGEVFANSNYAKEAEL